MYDCLVKVVTDCGSRSVYYGLLKVETDCGSGSVYYEDCGSGSVYYGLVKAMTVVVGLCTTVYLRVVTE